MKRLLANMFSSEHPSDVVIVNGISVLLTALERRYCIEILYIVYVIRSCVTLIGVHEMHGRMQLFYWPMIPSRRWPTL